MDYLPFPGYADPDKIAAPESPAHAQQIALKEAININEVNFKFQPGNYNVLYGEAVLTPEAKSILNLKVDEEKQGYLVVKSPPANLVSTLTWRYQPSYSTRVLRLWVTEVKSEQA